MDYRKRLIDLGWRQGVLLKPEKTQLKGNAHYDINGNDLLLVVSQTCDLVQSSFDNEPYFETLCIHPLGGEPNGAYLGGKNSRRIEFGFDPDDSGLRHWYALPFERHLVDRAFLLENRAPVTLLDSHNLGTILAWLSRRYTRAAFPEEFVRRCKVREKQLSKNFSRLNPLVSNVYIRLTSFEELSDEQKYAIELMLVMRAVDFEDPEKFAKCDEIRELLEKQFEKCPGIVVESITTESSADLTIEELSGHRDWDYSYLSFREPENAALPIDL